MLCIKLGNVRPTARRRCVAELARVYICEWYARHDGLYRSVFVMAWRRARRMYMHASLYYAWLCGVVYALYAKYVLCVCVCGVCLCTLKRKNQATRGESSNFFPSLLLRLQVLLHTLAYTPPSFRIFPYNVFMCPILLSNVVRLALAQYSPRHFQRYNNTPFA